MTSQSNGIAFERLHYPEPWPPPSIQPQPNPFARVPLLSGVLGAICAFLTLKTPSDELYRIEKQIIDQLQSRAERNNDWPTDPLRRRIVEILGAAILAEKGFPLDHVTLHPDDPIILLMWGASDDLTPLIFLAGLEREFEIRIPKDDRTRLIPC